MRIFLGVPVPDALIGDCVRAQGLIRGGRPVAPDDLHVTLCFCEDADEDAVDLLNDDLSLRVLPGCKIALSGIAGFAFPAHSVAAEVVAEPGLRALHDQVSRAMRRAGMVADAKRFRPHVTLARGKPDGSRLMMAPPASAAVPVRALNLWQSSLTPGGSVYEVLASYPLSEV